MLGDAGLNIQFPWTASSNLVIHHCWVGVLDLLYDAAYHPAFPVMSPCAKYPAPKPLPANKRGDVLELSSTCDPHCCNSHQSKVRAMPDKSPYKQCIGLSDHVLGMLLECAKTHGDSMLQADSFEPLSAVSLALMVVCPGDVDADVLNSFLKQAAGGLSSISNRRRLVPPSLFVLHAFNAILFNTTTIRIALSFHHVMENLSTRVLELLELGINAGNEEKRGILTSTALWLNALLSSNTLTNSEMHQLVQGLSIPIIKLVLYGPVPLPSHLMGYNMISYCTYRKFVTINIPSGLELIDFY